MSDDDKELLNYFRKTHASSCIVCADVLELIEGMRKEVDRLKRCWQEEAEECEDLRSRIERVTDKFREAG